MIKYCSICIWGIAGHIIEDSRSDMEKIESKPGEIIGAIDVCDHCMEKIKNRIKNPPKWWQFWRWL